MGHIFCLTTSVRFDYAAVLLSLVSRIMGSQPKVRFAFAVAALLAASHGIVFAGLFAIGGLGSMKRMKSVFAVFMCVAFILVMAGPSLAWELKLTGSLNWYYEYYNQMGSQGFFGPYNVDNGVGTTTANLNFWWEGPHLAQNLATGASAGGAYFYVLMDPVLIINPAINLKGRYRLGQWNNPQTGYYNTWDAPGSFNGFSEGQWTMFWATVSLPWGTLGVGKRPWIFGTGLQYDGGGALTTESVVLTAPLGPLDIGIGFYPHRPVHTTGGPPFGFDPGFVVDPYNLIVPQYFNIGDKSGSHIGDLLGFVVYNNGPLQAGVPGIIRQLSHRSGSPC